MQYQNVGEFSMKFCHTILKLRKKLILCVIAAASLNHAFAQCVAPPAGLISWWPGDGNALDLQGGNNGTLKNGATFAPGLVGQAFSFDGIDGYLDYGTQSNLNFAAGSAFTIDGWVKTTDAYGPIVSQRSSLS